jgi:uncharacterized integral membrane protein (TIGR00697 family)
MSELRGARPSPLLLAVSALFVACLMTSNVIAAKLVTIGPATVPAAIVLFPLAYLFGDVLTEVWGYAVARMVIWAGFLANALAAGFIAIAVALPPASIYPGQPAFAQVLDQTPRLVGASLIAYLCGEFLNSFVLAKLKVFTRGRFLWMRTIGSTVIGQGVDSIVFITLAFIGTAASGDIPVIVRDVWVIKVVYEVLATPLTYVIVTVCKRVEGIDVFDRDTSFAPVSLRGASRLLGRAAVGS